MFCYALKSGRRYDFMIIKCGSAEMENRDGRTQIFEDEASGVHGVIWNGLDSSGRQAEIAVVQVSDETHNYVAMTSNVINDRRTGSNKSTRPLPADEEALVSKTFKSKSGRRGKRTSIKTKDSRTETGPLDDETLYELRPLRNSGRARSYKTTTLKNQTSRGGDLPLNKNAAYSTTKLNSPSVYCLVEKESPQVSANSSNSSRRKYCDHATHHQEDPSTSNYLEPTISRLLCSIKDSQTSSDDVGLLWWEPRNPVSNNPVTLGSHESSSQVDVGCCKKPRAQSCQRSPKTGCCTGNNVTIEIEIPLNENISLGYHHPPTRISNETPIRRPTGPYVPWWEKSVDNSKIPWDNSISKTTSSNKSKKKYSAKDRARLNEQISSPADDPSEEDYKTRNENEPQSICCPNCHESILFSKSC